MFTLFLDDSGTRPSNKVAIATALVIPAKQICSLEKEWNTLKAKERFECFHASPCNARKVPFSDWNDAKVDRVFARVRQITKKYGVIAFSAAVHKKFYDEEAPADYKVYTGRYHYTWCVGMAIAYAERWRNNPARRISSPFEFVFDHMDLNNPARKEIEKVMAICERATREEGRKNEYTNYSFRSKEDFPGLQCVDGLAWASYCFACHRLYQKPLPNRAAEYWSDFGGDRGPNGWLRAFHFTREALRRFFAEDRRDGRTLARFRRWEKEDREKRI